MEKNRTPVWIAAWKGQLEKVKFLANQGADLNQADDYGQSPVWVAARFGHTEIVKFLIEKNVNLEEKLLQIAKKEEIKWLIADELNKIQTNFWNGLQEGRVDVIESLAGKVSLDRVNDEGCTPVLVAARCGHIEIVEFFATKNVDLDSADKRGHTPVFVAAWCGRIEVVKFLATKNVDLNRPDIVGQTPTFIAAAEGRTEVVKFLGTQNVDLNRANNFGRSPVHVAAINGHTEIVRILIEKNAKVDENLLWSLSTIKTTIEIKCLISDARKK